VKPVPSGVLLAHLNNLNRRALAERKPKKPMLVQTAPFSA
jgi:hypothetical protein